MPEENLFLPAENKLIKKFYELVIVRISRVAYTIFIVIVRISRIASTIFFVAVIYKLQFLSQNLFTCIVFLLLIRYPTIIEFFLISKISNPCNYLCKGYSTRLEHLNTKNLYNKK